MFKDRVFYVYLVILSILFIGIGSAENIDRYLTSKQRASYPQYTPFGLSVEEKEAKKSVVKVNTALGHGSGFYIKPNYIVTNYHVVEGFKGKVYMKPTIYEISTEKSYEGLVIHADPLTDTAVIYTPKNIGVPIKGVSMALPEIGTTIFYWGNPSEYTGSFARGYVVNNSRIIDILPGSRSYQVNLPILGGSSGSPVFNKQGLLIGVVYAASTKNSQFAFISPAASFYHKTMFAIKFHMILIDEE